jgi:hypothetical protein
LDQGLLDKTAGQEELPHPELNDSVGFSLCAIPFFKNFPGPFEGTQSFSFFLVVDVNFSEHVIIISQFNIGLAKEFFDVLYRRLAICGGFLFLGF